MGEPPATAEIHAGLLIGGEWVSEGRDRRDSVSPVTGEVIGSFVLGTAEDVDRAISAARAAAPAWATKTVYERIELLEAVVRVLEARRKDLATLMTLEQGKPYAAEAWFEVDEAIGHFNEAALGARTLLEGRVVPSAVASCRNYVYRVPLGVVGAIQPWNFPLGMAAQHVAPAIAAGNTVVSIPAPTTSLVAHLFMQCLVEAGLPAGVVNFVTGEGAVVGDALTADERVNAVIFTGSTATGKLVAANAKERARLLELGGNGPMVVLEDADLDRAVAGVMEGALLNAGQACSAAELILVHDDVYDEFAERLAEAVRSSVVLGNPFEETTTMGPLQNEPTAAKVDSHVADAVAKGATILTGGARAERFPTELYWPATVLAGVTGEMAISQAETFGPVMPLQRISSEEEALRLIDESSYGLSAAVFTENVGRGLKFAERASAGSVNVNTSSVWTELALPFGGRSGKGSGVGRVQGHYALEAFIEYKTIIVDLGGAQ
ncbi:aldehyde dehydrogenase [Streptomyces antnestii]|uniref:Aldehyde dehydrogenase n=1 Tax=Streptomyces antnestii TaxID=2494256 RepID=A0A3S3UKI4_9ACTN|nr:aldehyde dehydrogenase family protein [Streptomyces sp. San01]RVU29031.1 aldehyde dehydrogenase [Streptomyces sp. San01]